MKSAFCCNLGQFFDSLSSSIIVPTHWPYQKSQERGGDGKITEKQGDPKKRGFCRKGRDAVSLVILSDWGVANVLTSNYILVIVFLFPLNVGVSPCFHCTDLVLAYRVYTYCFHNTVVSSCYRLHTSCLHRVGVTTCFSLNRWF